jgi:XTP/dITP diphosphohydrolase
MEEKSRVSHRGKALQELCSEFIKVMVWLERHMPPTEPMGCMGDANDG